MEPVMITCELCGQDAFVHKARYRYRAESSNGRPANEHVLLEVQRQVECPTCGMRTQVQTENEE
jgi:hypothetical protein